MKSKLPILIATAALWFCSLTEGLLGQTLLITTQVNPFKYGLKVNSLSSTITIPRRRTDIGKGTLVEGSTQYSLPGGCLQGTDQFATVLDFATSVTGTMVQTEGYGLTTVGYSWNEDNTVGDTTFTGNLCSSIKDLTINGHSVDSASTNTVFRADGVRAQSQGFNCERVRFTGIPGTALTVKQPNGTAAGLPGIYDAQLPFISQVYVLVAQNGIKNYYTDAKYQNIDINGITGDGFINHGSACYVNRIHVWGCQGRALYTDAQIELDNAYLEAAPYGLYLDAGSDQSTVNNLQIGPGTTWNRSVYVNSGDCKLHHVHGTVRSPDGTHNDVAGIELVPGAAGEVIDYCDFNIPGASRGVIFRGFQNKLSITGGCADAASKLVDVEETIKGCTIDIDWRGSAGIVLDMTNTSLDSVDGKGNVINVHTSGTPTTKVKYPGGGTTFNLHSGTTLTVDGILQQ